jgi:hypothetical protein
MMNLVAQIRDRLCKNIVEIPGHLVRTFIGVDYELYSSHYRSQVTRL